MKFKGIASYSAKVVFAALKASPWLKWLTAPVIGAVTYVLLERAFGWLASKGIIALKVGVQFIRSRRDLSNFNNVIETAIKKVDGKRDLTDEEIKDIDGKVMAAARRFLAIPGVRDG